MSCRSPEGTGMKTETEERGAKGAPGRASEFGFPFLTARFLGPASRCTQAPEARKQRKQRQDGSKFTEYAESCQVTDCSQSTVHTCAHACVYICVYMCVCVRGKCLINMLFVGRAYSCVCVCVYAHMYVRACARARRHPGTCA